MMFARLKPGMTIPEARARLMGVLEELDRVKPEEGWKRASVGTRVFGVTGTGNLKQTAPGAVTAFFAMLVAVVGLVLLIACTNVASMLLARAASREHELAIRVSLGAGRLRLMRHLLAESLLLTTMGAAGGVAISAACGELAGRIRLPVPMPFHLVMAPDWRLLWYSLGLVASATLLCGLLPAMKAVRGEVNPALKRQERQTEGTWSLRGAMVTGQIAVSALLLAAGFLFLHNLARASSLDPGFDVRHTIWAYMRLAPGAYADKGQKKQTALARGAIEGLRALPGVEAAAITRIVPLNDNWHESTSIRPDGARDAIRVEIEVNDVGPGYFRTAGTPILAGREFDDGDGKGSQPMAIVNEEFAREVFGGTNPVGHTILSDGPGALPVRIVGLAKNSKYFAIGEKQKAAVYHPYFASEEPVNLHFLARVAGAPESYVRAINGVLGKLDGTAAIETKPMSRALGLAMPPSEAGAVTLGAMGLLGLVLAAAGLYGVLLYTVSRRTREIGLRVALGARPMDVARMVSGQSLALAGSGMAMGLGIAYFALRPLALFLVPGLNAVDVPAFGEVVGVLIAVAVLATVVPVSRAPRVDPMVALRCE